MIVFTYPGQGSQKMGMGEKWLDHPSWELVIEASSITGRDLSSLLLEASDEELKETRNAQVATFLTSMVIFDSLQRVGVEAAAHAGHSLGEYSALTASGALDFEDAVKLVSERGEAMQVCAESREGTMAAILGLDDELVESACHRVDDDVWVANFNAPGQVVIAGSPSGIDTASEIAKEIGAKLLFDAAHQCGLIAGKMWSNPLDHGADVVTMSTYKSLGGPPGGVIVTNDPEIAKKIDSIAFPGMTANFDAAKSAALAVTMLDWRDYGEDYVSEMVLMAKTLASCLEDYDVPVFFGALGHTQSHQFAVLANEYRGGQEASKLLRKSGLLACGIGLPVQDIEGDMNGIRFGTPELVRWGMTAKHSNKLADLIAKALNSQNVSDQVSEWRRTFNKIHFVN